MPSKPNRPCAVPGCPSVAVQGKARCADHARQHAHEVETNRPSASRRGYDSKWRVIRAQFLKKHPVCSVVGCGKPSTDVDHIIPIREGGSNHWDNLQAFCHSCHSKKTAALDGGGFRAF